MAQSVKEFTAQLTSISAKMVLDDWTWKVFGYKKRPKRGTKFNRFVNQKKLVSETFLVREIFISCFSSGIITIQFNRNMFERILDFMLERFLNTEGIINALRFDSKREAKNYLLEGLREYAGIDLDSFVSVFIKRASDFTEDTFNKGWLVSASRLTVDKDSPWVIINNSTRENFNIKFVDDL
ncbi:hypothetical protein [Paenibacillus sp. FSL R10-2788]|uniref:hypothetical protein n=1 Tax=Paenibacillus sp. FSL R10-2788 TaxID=2954694 RepID=UPI0030F7372C